MSGLYVHIPFCARHCPYCDFAVSTERKQESRSRYLSALRRELEVSLSGSAPLKTIFFGGGTPTELAPSDLNSLLELIRATAGIESGAEISLESNPENLSAEYLKALASAGWNRLSLGAQSLDAGVLHFLGRRHDPEWVLRCVDLARDAGFENISLDLIYAVPGQSIESWRETVRGAVRKGVPHVSAYTLTIEPATVFGRRAAEGRLLPLTDDAQAEYMEIAAEELAKGGLERYEVSNWARLGFECRHNQNYWRGGDYLAAGCGAHGHRAGHRWWNERDTETYVKGVLETGSALAGEEFLNPMQRLEERLALALRSVEGLRLDELSKELELDVPAILDQVLDEAVRYGWIIREGDLVRPKAESLMLADGIAAHILSRIDLPVNATP